MNRIAQTTMRALLALSAVSIGAVFAQDMVIDWHTVDGGGEMFSTGGGFELGGSIGQPDASLFAMSGGSLQLTGGFWPGAIAGPAPVPGDCDGDGDVDLEDYTDFEACLAGPGGGLGPDCGCVDFDDNGDVDLRDFAAFAEVFMGPLP
jgi:hypothetical protein